MYLLLTSNARHQAIRTGIKSSLLFICSYVVCTIVLLVNTVLLLLGLLGSYLVNTVLDPTVICGEKMLVLAGFFFENLRVSKQKSMS